MKANDAFRTGFYVTLGVLMCCLLVGAVPVSYFYYMAHRQDKATLAGTYRLAHGTYNATPPTYTVSAMGHSVADCTYEQAQRLAQELSDKGINVSIKEGR